MNALPTQPVHEASEFVMRVRAQWPTAKLRQHQASVLVENPDVRILRAIRRMVQEEGWFYHVSFTGKGASLSVRFFKKGEPC